MDEEGKKPKRRKKAADGDGQKEHKPNWREVYATVQDIQEYLRGHVMLRHNVVTRRVECRLLERDPWEHYDGSAESAMLLLAAVAKREKDREERDGQPPDWEPISDRIVNSLWADMSLKKPVRRQDIYSVIESDFVPDYNPFRYYLDHLTPWNGTDDYIMELSLSVNVKGGVDDQLLFVEYLRKWLVAMVAGWVDDTVVNNVMLVLIGPQGSYKTTWFNYLLPPELRGYTYTKANGSRMGRDDLLVLAQYGLVCCEELDTMSSRELNQLKAAMTMPSIDERAAYAHFHEHRPHIASFCGTGNNVQFLSDETGNRRWLPFEIDSICSPRDEPFNYEGIYAQAYALYRQGFQFWFSQAEIQRLARHNEAFEAPHPEQELILEYLRKPGEGEQGVFLSVSNILQLVGSNPVLRLTANKIGRTMTALGFERQRFGQERGYVVVLYSPEEIKARQRTKAYEARPESGVGHDADDANDTNVTIF